MHLTFHLFLSILALGSAWTPSRPTKNSFHSSRNSILHSLASPPASDGKDVEKFKGKLLEGGKIIDFSAVKASSRAEEALSNARQTVLASAEDNNPATGTSEGHSILGINQDVISEVGHELGAFATPQQVQDCASYLRSKAPTGLFKDDQKKQITESQIRTSKEILEKAYFEAGEVTSAFAKTFYMGTMLLEEEPRKAIWAIYVWCRRTDEIVDAPRDDENEMLQDLSVWEMRLEKLWERGEVKDVYDLCLLDVRVKYPDLDITPFMDMIRGMLMDVPGLGQDRYDHFDQLHLYCYRVAGTVGIMSLPVFGCAPGFNEEVAR